MASALSSIAAVAGVTSVSYLPAISDDDAPNIPIIKRNQSDVQSKHHTRLLLLPQPSKVCCRFYLLFMIIRGVPNELPIKSQVETRKGSENNSQKTDARLGRASNRGGHYYGVLGYCVCFWSVHYRKSETRLGGWRTKGATAGAIKLATVRNDLRRLLRIQRHAIGAQIWCLKTVRGYPHNDWLAIAEKMRNGRGWLLPFSKRRHTKAEDELVNRKSNLIQFNV